MTLFKKLLSIAITIDSHYYRIVTVFTTLNKSRKKTIDSFRSPAFVVMVDTINDSNYYRQQLL